MAENPRKPSPNPDKARQPAKPPAGKPQQPLDATPAVEDRRGFGAKITAVVIGGFVGLVPMVAGIVTFLDPLRRKGLAGDFVRVATVDSLPADGTPRQVSVIAKRTDAWNSLPSQPIGAVYLRALPEGKVEAFNATCPHAGCFIAYAADDKIFRCPCHTSSFQLDGSIIEPSPSPRSMDKLDCEVRQSQGRSEVWVKFINYYPGKAEQIAKP